MGERSGRGTSLLKPASDATRDREKAAGDPPGGHAEALKEKAAGGTECQCDRKALSGPEVRSDNGPHHRPSQAVRRRVASLSCSALRRKQRRMKGSPPRPKAVPGAIPIFASSTSVSPSLPVSAASVIVKKR